MNIPILKTCEDVCICDYHMAHGLEKCIHRKLNVADFQCKHKGKYTLNVLNIML